MNRTLRHAAEESMVNEQQQQRKTKTRDAELSDRGWKNRGTFDEPRLLEIVEMYLELGFEVRQEPFDPDESPGCVTCMRLTPELFKTVYTREKK